MLAFGQQRTSLFQNKTSGCFISPTPTPTGEGARLSHCDTFGAAAVPGPIVGARIPGLVTRHHCYGLTTPNRLAATRDYYLQAIFLFLRLGTSGPTTSFFADGFSAHLYCRARLRISGRELISRRLRSRGRRRYLTEIDIAPRSGERLLEPINENAIPRSHGPASRAKG